MLPVLRKAGRIENPRVRYSQESVVRDATMTGLFDLLGACVAIYTAYAAATGRVYVRHRAWGRSVLRSDEPRYFWLNIVIYSLLAVALITVF